MKREVRAIVALAICCPFRIAAGAPDDSLCEPLRQFASSVQPGQTRELAFHTIWGGGFKDSPSDSALYQTRCTHNGYEPAKAVCSYLRDNANVEFANTNLERALECLSPGTHLRGLVRVHRGEFALRVDDAERGNRVKMTFDQDPVIGGEVLQIAVEGYMP